MIDQRKFDEMVRNTESYLTDLLKRVTELEAKVAALEPKKATRSKASEA